MTHAEAVKLMGQVVTVKVELVRDHVMIDGAPQRLRSTWERKDRIEPRAGWVVGIRWLMDGVYDPAYWDDDPIEGRAYVPAEFHPEKSVPCVRVAYWPTMTPVPVPLDGYEMGGTPLSPHQWQCQPLPERIEP